MKRAASLAAVSLLVTACAHRQAEQATARFVESGVEVTITVSSSKVTAVYRPTMPGYHIYSIDLPPGGVEGLGVPTRLSVRAGLTATGRATADKAVRMLDLPAVKVKLPVYPDGPVAVSLPVQRSGSAADIVVSYGACSANTCLAPVLDHLTHITLR